MNVLSLRRFRRPTGRRLMLLVVLVVVVAVVLAVGGVFSSDTTAAPATATAQVGTVRTSLAATGTIQPAQQSNLSFPAGGKVTAVDVSVGQPVSQGQTLASLDSVSLTSQAAQQRASVATDQAKVDADEASTTTSSTQLAADRAALTAANAQLAAAEQNVGGTAMTSPITGVVAAVNISAGQQVSGGASTTSSSGSASSGAAASASSSAGTQTTSGSGSGGSGSAGPGSGSSGTSSGTSSGGSSTASGSAASGSASSAQIVVISAGSYLVDASVDDTQVGQVHTGQTAEATPAGAQQPVPGVVSTVGMLATSSSGVASYPVTVEIDRSPTPLFAGAAAQVTIVTAELAGVLTVPSAAVHDDGGVTTVTAVHDGAQTLTPVVVGAASEGRTQIVSGLALGTAVVVPSAPRTATGSSGGTGSGGGGLFGGRGGGGASGSGGSGGSSGGTGGGTGGAGRSGG